MPNCGSQCYLCDVPIRFDTYNGCSHACEYCFAKQFTDISKIKKNETVKQLKNFIEGKRNAETNWCDWDIPIHWGGLSDPFQPCEKKMRLSYECLKLFVETQYPFIVSTKGKLVATEEYLSLLEKCNCVVQVSAVCSSYDKLELGCPSYEKRLEIISKLSKRVKRVIVRIQPYMHEVFDEVYDNLEKVKNAGAYGVIIEGMKFKKKKPGLIKIGGDFVYPYDLIMDDFLKLKSRAHQLGLKIYAGENRIRRLGDSLTCCGIDGMEGFKPNTFNLNHILNGDTSVKPTDKMRENKTGGCFRTMYQDTVNGAVVENQSFAFNMLNEYKQKKNSVDKIMGVDMRGKTVKG